jgi:hypothetical protein
MAAAVKLDGDTSDTNGSADAAEVRALVAALPELAAPTSSRGR